MLRLVKEKTYKDIQEDKLIDLIKVLIDRYDTKIKEGGHARGVVFTTGVTLSHQILEGGKTIIRNPVVDLFIKDKQRALSVLHRFSHHHDYTVTVVTEHVFTDNGIVAYFSISTTGNGTPKGFPILKAA